MAETREIDVAHVARLARLNLTPEEAELFQGQLARVLEYAEKLVVAAALSPAAPSVVAAGVPPADPSVVAAGVSPADPSVVAAGVPPAKHPAPAPARPDESHPWFTTAQALANAPRQANDLFIVPKVVE
jgi:aspartyl-tRNA(Asn)/glutamyl-tRNA(Gln) amidotransferase subunit C